MITNVVYTNHYEIRSYQDRTCFLIPLSLAVAVNVSITCSIHTICKALLSRQEWLSALSADLGSLHNHFPFLPLPKSNSAKRLFAFVGSMTLYPINFSVSASTLFTVESLVSSWEDGQGADIARRQETIGKWKGSRAGMAWARGEREERGRGGRRGRGRSKRRERWAHTFTCIHLSESPFLSLSLSLSFRVSFIINYLIESFVCVTVTVTIIDNNNKLLKYMLTFLVGMAFSS